MPVYFVECVKTVEFTLKADSLEEAQEAVDNLTDWELGDFAGGDEWDRRVTDATETIRKLDKLVTCPARKPIKPDCALHEGQIMNFGDYQRLGIKEPEEPKPADDATLVLPFPAEMEDDDG